MPRNWNPPYKDMVREALLGGPGDVLTPKQAATYCMTSKAKIDEWIAYGYLKTIVVDDGFIWPDGEKKYITLVFRDDLLNLLEKL